MDERGRVGASACIRVPIVTVCRYHIGIFIDFESSIHRDRVIRIIVKFR